MQKNSVNLDRKITRIKLDIEGFIFSEDLFNAILNQCSPKTIIKIKLCSNLFSKLIPFDYIFNRWRNFCPRNLDSMNITSFPLNGALVKSLERDIDKRKYECAPILDRISKHLGKNHSATWGIDSKDNIFLCCRVKLFGTCLDEIKGLRKFCSNHYLILNQNEDRSVPWFKNIKIIGSKSYEKYSVTLSEGTLWSGFCLLKSLTKDKQEEYWTRIFTGKKCGLLLASNPIREIAIEAVPEPRFLQIPTFC